MMLSKSGGHKADVTSLYSEGADCVGASTLKSRQIESSQTQRRKANYLQVIARAPSSLSGILTSHPYDMPVNLLDKLRTSHDVELMSRRLTTRGGVHSDSECVIFFLVSCCLHLVAILLAHNNCNHFFQTILRRTWLFLPEWPSCGANRVTRTREGRHWEQSFCRACARKISAH